MKVIYVIVGLVVLFAAIILGLLVAKGPQPEVILPAEVITKIGFLNITNTMITSWIVAIFLIVFAFFATRGLKIMPSGIQNFAESVVGFIFGQSEEIAGEQKARKLFPVVATIFLMVLVSNWFGLLPFFNAIGKTEDVGVEIFHELADDHPHKLELTEDGTYAEDHKFGMWTMDEAGSIVIVKPRASAYDFEVKLGETGPEAFDRYIVFLARTFDVQVNGQEITEEQVEAPTPELIQASYEALQVAPDAPKLLLAAAEGGDDHAEEGAEGEDAAEGEEHATIASPVLGETFSGVDFSESQRLALVIPYFRSVYSDVNNTLALGFVAFFFIQFWGFSALGPGYAKKFFNLNGVMSFVGILELLSEFIRIISFAFRLFGNIFAGEVLILMLTFLMPFLIVDLIYGLELFVGFIQAAVFALLTLVFGSMAMEHHGEDDHEGHDDVPHGEPHEGAAQAAH